VAILPATRRPHNIGTRRAGETVPPDPVQIPPPRFFSGKPAESSGSAPKMFSLRPQPPNHQRSGSAFVQ
jgi:hypothetical protein